VKLLAADIGNTQIQVGLFDGEVLGSTRRLPSRRDTTADELAVLVGGALADEARSVEGAVLASVVPPLTNLFVSALVSMGIENPLVVAPGIKTGLKIRTDSPQEVGADRIVNAVAASDRHSPPLVVVDFGTATTFDVVSDAGEYLGGAITPGPMIGAEALSMRAARLPRVEISAPEYVIGKNTVDSIRSGLLHGHAAMAEGMIARIEGEMQARLNVVATGGLAEQIVPLMKGIHTVDMELTLHGLRLIHERNAGR